MDGVFKYMGFCGKYIYMLGCLNKKARTHFSSKPHQIRQVHGVSFRLRTYYVKKKIFGETRQQSVKKNLFSAGGFLKK